MDILTCVVSSRLTPRDSPSSLPWEEAPVLFDIPSSFRSVWNGRNLLRICARAFLLYPSREKLDLLSRRFGVLWDNSARLGSEGSDWSEWEPRIWLRLSLRSCSICRFGPLMTKGLRPDVGSSFREIIWLLYHVYSLPSTSVTSMWWVDIQTNKTNEYLSFTCIFPNHSKKANADEQNHILMN